jgi:4-amino-4-deoxy-L-arabinose transferase-like glycosyltransferase
MVKKLILIVILAGCAFIPFIGSMHLFDWDEANFAELAREMIVSGDYLKPQINFMPFYEKPPLFIWFQVLSMKIFGINEFAARFPNAIAGIIILVSLFLIGKKHFGERVGWLWALSFGASMAPHFYFKSGLIDPIFNFFIFLAIYYFLFLFLDDQGKKWKFTLLSALFTAFAVMTKGPVAIILIVGSLGFTWLLIKFKGWRNLAWVIPWIIVMVGLSSIWFLYITKAYGDTYVKEFITYQIRLFETEDAKHGGSILFHPIALILGCFPASIFMWSAFSKNNKPKEEFQEILFIAMLACGIVVLVVFSLVKTKIIHYSSMDYYPITFFSSIGISYLIDKNSKLSNALILILGLIGSIWFLALVLTPIVGNNIELVKPYIGDKNLLEQLKTPIQWHYAASILGLIFGVIFFYGIYKIRSNTKHGMLAIFIACVFCTQSIALYYLPRIEKLVQGSLVEFCQTLKGKDVNTQSLYVKSYNQYFYSDRQPFKNIEDTLKHLHYLYYPLEKDCYFILRSIDRINMDTSRSPNAEELLSKEGFIFYLRRK